MPANVDDILHSHDQLKQQRRPWEATWQAIADVIMPAFNDIQGARSPGTTRTQRLYDSTGMYAGMLLAGHMAGAITNFQTRWFAMRHSLEMLNDLKAVSVWLDAAAKAMQDKLSATTTPQAFHEKYLQFCNMGTGALFVDDARYVDPMLGSSSLLSRSLPIATYSVAENAAGLVDTLYRELELSPRQAEQQWGANALHESARRSLDSGQQKHVPTTYLHAVYPRRERDASYENQANMAYASCYVDVQHKHLVSEGGYRWFPFMVSRWQKLRSWSPWGFGPGHIALPEVLTLNRMDRDVLNALQVHINPPFWTDDPDAVGLVKLWPGYINPIAHGRTINPMRGPGDFNISHLGMEERRQRVRQVYFMDQLITLPAPDQTGKMTAYEVAQRIAFMQRLMGPAFMRLLSEFLNPFIDITFGTMLENDELPEPPDVVIEAALQGYGKITVDYEGPLARAQRGDELTAIEGVIAAAERIYASTQDPEAWDPVNITEAIQRIGKAGGIPPSVLRDQAEILKRQEARRQAQEAAAQAEGVREDVKALGPASQMVKALAPAPQGAA